jgi:UMF1 family MFS transporter
VSVPWRAIDGDAAVHEFVADLVNVVDGIGEVAEVTGFAVVLRIPVPGQFDLRILVAAGGKEHQREAALLAFLATELFQAEPAVEVVVATAFAADELGVETQSLLILVLMIQFVAFGGAFLFGYLARRMGAKRAIMISLAVWAAIVIYAYLLLTNEVQLYVLGFFLALVLGGSQALSRSLFSQMIPADHEAEYFGFYEISERGTSWLGPLAFAAAVQITGSQRVAIVSLIIFFVVGLVLLARVDVKQAMVEAGNNPAGVVL